MPATRSSSHQQIRAQPFPSQSPPRAPRHPTTSNEVINLTESDAESSTAAARRAAKPVAKPKSRTRQPAKVISTEVIDISSDTDEDEVAPPVVRATIPAPTPEPARIAEIRREVRKYRDESAKHKKEFERALKELEALREENQELQALRKPADGKIVLDAAKVTDHLDCEICTGRMWTPYVLPDCGHTYCQSCLQDWFLATKTQYVAAHPEYNALQHQGYQYQLAEILQMIMQNPAFAVDPQVTAMVKQIIPPGPEYTCPTCREPVKTRPTESFGLKALARTIGAATGENSPKKAAPSARGRAKAPAANAAGPWDDFFPKKRA